MASPLKGCNLVGTLVAAASNSTTAGDNLGTELGLAVGTSLTGGASAVTNSVALPSRKLSLLFLAQVSSNAGSTTYVADVATNGALPTFSSSAAVTVTDPGSGTPVFVGPVVSYDCGETVSLGLPAEQTVQNTVALKITPTNTCTVKQLALLATIVVGAKSESHTIKQAFSIKAPPAINLAGMSIDGSGVWKPNT